MPLLPPISLDLMEAYTTLRPLALAIIGMAIYGVFVFNFYRFIARKDIIKLDLDKYNHSRRRIVRKSIASLLYVLKFLVIFPALVFFWFVVVAFLLSLMVRNQSLASVLLAAISVVGSIRICAYYNQALSTDLAKILPFALLGIMLIDRTLVNIPTPSSSLEEVISHWETMVYYMGAVVTLEFVMRILSGGYGLIRRRISRRAESRQTSDAGGARQSAPVAHDAAPRRAAASALDEDYAPRPSREPSPLRSMEANGSGSSFHGASASPRDRRAIPSPLSSPLGERRPARDLSAGTRRAVSHGSHTPDRSPAFAGRSPRGEAIAMPWERGGSRWRSSRTASHLPKDPKPRREIDDSAPSSQRAAALDHSFEKLAYALSKGRNASD